jgi:hypothetical protein
MATALTLYVTTTLDGTLTHAADLVAVTGASASTSNHTVIGTNSGWGELGLGANPTWAAGAGPGAGDGYGAIWNVTTLEGTLFPAGTWTFKTTVSTAVGTETGTLELLVYAYNAGVYTQLGTGTLASATYGTGGTAVSIAASLPAVTFGTGDKLYFECWFNSTSHTGTPTNMLVTTSNSATLGRAGAGELDTPGYLLLLAPSGVTLTGTGTLAGTFSLSGNVYYANPGDNLQTLCAALAPGDTLYLNDGIYAAAPGNPCLRVVGATGTALAPITIAALNDGKAILDGGGTTYTDSQPIFVTNSSYVTIEGLVAQNSCDHVVYVYGGTGSGNGPCDHITIRRCTAHGAAPGNNHCFNTHAGNTPGNLSYITFEDCAAWGPGRYMFILFEVQYGVMRRCYAYWNTINNNLNQPRAGFGVYNSQHSTVENCIARHAIPQAANVADVWDSNYYEGLWSDSSDTTNFPNDYSHYYGCIFYNNWEAAHINEVTGLDTEFIHCYFECPQIAGTPLIDRTQGCGLWSDSPHAFAATNCTFNGSIYGYRQGSGATGIFTNCAFTNNSTAVSASAITHANCGFYGNAANGVTPAATDLTSNPWYNTSTYGRGGALFLPPASPYKGAGAFGADIGANVLYQYQNGVLTGTPLWPWPMEGRVVAELGVSPTYDIWSTLTGLYTGSSATAGQLTGAISANTMRLGTETLADAEASVRLQVSASGDIVGVTLRDASLSQFVRLQLSGTSLQLCQQTPSGGFVVLASYAFAPTAGAWYWLKLRAVGATLSGKVWAEIQAGGLTTYGSTPYGSLGYGGSVAGAEPADWQVTAQATVLAAGQVGISAALAATGDRALFTDFAAISASSGGGGATGVMRDLHARAGLYASAPGTVLWRDLVCRARIVDLSGQTVTVTTYAAKRPPLERRFPKS